MSQKPPPLGLVSSSITSPSRNTPSAATETPSGLGQYGVVTRPRFMTNQITSPTTVQTPKSKGSNTSFRYRPSRPSLGYIFDNNHTPPQVNNASNNNSSGKAKDKSAKKAKSKSKNKSKAKNGTKMTRQEMEKMNGIRQTRKQSTLAAFSQTPNGQTFDAIKRELEFLKTEVPNFESKYQTALASFHATGHSKARQIEFAFIQALSEWILEDGAPAVKQLNDFKEDVHHEMTGLVSTCEDLSKQNQQLTIVIQDLQQQNADIQKAYSEAHRELSKLNVVIKDNEVEQEAEQLKENDFEDLSQDLELAHEQNKILKEKVGRLESYLKQTQKDNDDLTNKQFAMENESQQSKAEVAKLHAKVASMEQQHEHELLILAKAHEDYKVQMENEQAQLVQIAEESQKQIQQMAANMGKPRSGTVVTPMFDDEYNSNAPLAEDGGGVTLEAEFTQYPFSEDEWLDDSEDPPPAEATKLESVVLDEQRINIEPVKAETPPPFDAEFETIKQMMGKSPVDPTKTFKMEKEKRGVELADITKEFKMEKEKRGVDLEDVTKNFSNEKKAYSEETRDVTQEFSMEKQVANNEIKEKDVSMEFESVKESNTMETEDITKAWRAEKSGMMDVARVDPEATFVSEKKEEGVEAIDPTASFVSEKQEQGVEAVDPSKHFQSESQTMDLERADLSNTFIMERKLEIREEPKAEEFVMEKKKASMHQKESSLELQFSKTDLSYTPKTSDADKDHFESGRISIIQDKEPPRPQYAYQIRHLRMDVDAAPQRVTKIRKPPPAAHERPDFAKYYDGKDEIIRKSLAFQKIMSKWKKDEVEKGGKPEILRQREYELISKWNSDEKSKLSASPKMRGLPSLAPMNSVENNSNARNRSTRTNSTLATPGSPGFEFFSMSSKVTKARMHKLKPKLQGFMRVIRSRFVPKYQLKKEMAFYFCLDGLPSLTNLDKNEAEKDRRGDFLVPVLFFFENENEFKQLHREAGALAVRNAMFQKAFARHAKGIITLHTHACDASLEKAIIRLETLKGREIELKNKEKDTKEFTGKSMYVVNERDFHRFEFETEETRDAWLHKIHKLVQKRTNSVQRATETYQGSHKQSLGIGTPIQRATRASSKLV